MTFQQAWDLVRQTLRKGETVPVWSAAGQTRSAPFKIVSVGWSAIEVDPPAASKTWRIDRSEFEKVFRVWDDYCSRRVRRDQLRDLTHYSTYIVSILHLVEERTSTQLR